MVIEGQGERHNCQNLQRLVKRSAVKQRGPPGLFGLSALTVAEALLCSLWLVMKAS